MIPISDNLLDYILNYLRTEDNFVFLETSKFLPPDSQKIQNQKSFIFHQPVTLLTCNIQDDPIIFLRQAEDYLKQGYYLAGWFAYEFGYSLEPTLKNLSQLSSSSTLAKVGVFPPPIIYNHASGEFNTPSPFIDSANNPKSTNCEITNLRPSMTEKSFIQAISRIKDYIIAGDTYQVNYTLKYLFDFTGSPEELYKKLRRNQPVAYGSYLKLGNQRILSFSPELFFSKKDNHCWVKPMKGTAARGRTLHEDREIAATLANDPKNRSENVMIVDLLRNDLGKLCEIGSVKTHQMFNVETFSTLHQMTTTITGKLHHGTDLPKLFSSLFPCGSVTGAPKIRTMEIINELEDGTRGVYTGAIGYITPSGDATFNVPIRTIALENGRGEMGIGAGITHNSQPHAEWQESLLKGKFLSHPQEDFQLIETILWQGKSDTATLACKGFWLLEKHLNRLEDSAQYFSYPFNKKKLIDKLEILSTEWQQSDKAHTRRLRILLFRDGRTTITQVKCDEPSSLDIPVRPRSHANKLPKIILSDYRTNPDERMLFHKTTNRSLYNQERERAVEQGFYEVIFCNSRNEITEGAISNIIIKQSGELYTPHQASGLLAGVGRDYLFDSQNTLQEKTLYLPDLQNAQAIYLVNSVRGVVEVQLRK